MNEDGKRRGEEIQRKIEFIIRQRKQLASDMRMMRETQDRNDKRWAETEKRIRSLLSKVMRRYGGQQEF